MGERTRLFNWAATPVGDPSGWPPCLRTTVSNLLRSKFPMFLWWGEDMIQFYNDAYRPSLGNEGKHPSALGAKGRETWPEIWDIISPLHRQVETTGEATWMEDQLVPIYRNGKIEDVYWTFSYSSVLDEEGRHAGILVTCTETTGKVEALNQLKSSEQRFQNLIRDASAAIVVLTGPEMKVEIVNQAYASLIGRTTDDLLGHPLFSIIPEAEAYYLPLMEKVCSTGEPVFLYDSPYWVMAKGRRVEGFVHVVYQPYQDTSGAILGVIAILQDVTGQVLARKKIEEDERNLRNTILQAPVAICIFRGPQYVIEIANQSMIQFWGKQEEDVLNKPLFEAIPEAKNQGYEELLNSVFQRGEPFSAQELPITLPRNGVGQTVFINFAYEPIREIDGIVSGIMATATDVTAQVLGRQKIEEVVAQRTLELGEANRALVSVNKELSRSNHHLEEFAHAASHDLKEPIRKIHFFTERLKIQLQEIINPEQAHIFSRISNATQRMGMLIDDLLLYSHVSQRPHKKEWVNLNEKIKRVREDLELDIQEKGAKIEVRPLPLVQGYSRQLQQLFQNLLSNAIKYSKADVSPFIIVKASQVEKNGTYYHQIEVADNGIGFEQEYEEKIFQMFARLHGKSEYPGTGVGLAIVKKIVENHEGFIEVESTPGKGATFTIYLPM